MQLRNIPISKLEINRANDRHGELENETSAIAWLFKHRKNHMRNLTKDIVSKGKIFEPPLVYPNDISFIVYDGNRRVSCIKLLQNPRRAPTVELQEFFHSQRNLWLGEFPSEILCQVETNIETIDDILFRRHTGTQSGVGQSTWDDRMKSNFITRTGKGDTVSVADEIEKRLRDANLLPARRKIPRSTLNRLLSAETFRNRTGISVSRNRFVFTHKEDVALKALARIASDLAQQKLVLGDIWDNEGKRSYLDELEKEGILPTARDTLPKRGLSEPKRTTIKQKIAEPALRTTLIPQIDHHIVWSHHLIRHQHIWYELQFSLELNKHPNAISVLLRVLLELSAHNYIQRQKMTVHEKDSLANKIRKIGENLKFQSKIDAKRLNELNKLAHSEKIISADTLNRYVHSPNLNPSPEHLRSIWDSLADFICICLNS